MDLETQFSRYQQSGDPDALAQVFDNSAREVLKVAIHLSSGAAEAEDLVQETFLTAIKEAEHWDSTRRLMPWLLGILANKAGTARHRAKRHIDPERLRQTKVAPPVDQAVEREIGKTVQEKVAKLPEPYCRVLLLHLFEGLGAVNVAESLNLSPSTVRTQIQRGMDLLRQALPAGMAPGILFLPCRGLASIRQEVLTAAKTAVATSAGVGVTTMFGGLFMKKLITLLALLILTALGTLFAWQDGWFSPAAPPLPGIESSRAKATPQREEPAPEPARPIDISKGTTREPVVESKVNGNLALLPLDAKINLQAVDGITGEPLPGARIAWHSSTLAKTELQASLPAHLDNPYLKVCVDVGCLTNPPLPLKSFGQVVLADGNGAFTIPRIPGKRDSLRLRGRHGKLEGFMILPAEHLLSAKPQPFKLYPTNEVRIRVIDAAKKPVSGIPVAILAQVPRRDSTRLWLGRSGVNGMVMARYQLPEEIKGWKLTVAPLPYTLTTKPVNLPAPGSTIPTVTIQTPPTGTMEVVVKDQSNQPVTERLLVRIAVYKAPFSSIYGSLAAYTEEGKAVFSGIPLDIDYRMTLAVPGRAPSGRKQTRPGPTTKETTVRVTLPWGPVTRFTGRALTGDGQVMANMPIQAYSRICLTDASGHFSFRPEYNLTRIGTRSRKTTLIWWRQTTELALAHGYTADLVIPAPIPVAGMDLGDIIFSKPLIIATGRVQDEQGQPIPQVIIDVRTCRDDHIPGDNLPKVMTDRDGRFTITGKAVGQVTICPRKYGWVCPRKPSKVYSGSDKIITLQRSGSLVYDLKLDPSIPPSMGKVFLVNIKPDFRGYEPGTVYPLGRGKEVGAKDLKNLYPGTYMMIVRVKDVPLAQIGGILIESGKVTCPPQLNPLDLTGKMVAYSFKITAPKKLSSHDVDFLVKTPKKEKVALLSGHYTWPSTFTLALPKEVNGIVVRVDGYMPIKFNNPRPLNHIDLAGIPRGNTVKLKVAGKPEGFHGYPSLEYSGPPVAGLDAKTLELSTVMTTSSDERGIYTFRVPCPGPYQVKWDYCPNGDPRERFCPMKQTTYRTLQVKAGTIPQKFTITLTADQVPKAPKKK